MLFLKVDSHRYMHVTIIAQSKNRVIALYGIDCFFFQNNANAEGGIN